VCVWWVREEPIPVSTADKAVDMGPYSPFPPISKALFGCCQIHFKSGLTFPSISKVLFECCQIHFNPYVLEWIEVEFKFHFNSLQYI